MDVFSLNSRVIEQYEQFARSFTKIRSGELLDKVGAKYEGKVFWPDPLLQINPHYESGGSIRDLVDKGELEPECAEIFRGVSDVGQDPGGMDLVLHKHQQQAIGHAKTPQSYVVTTGTGSGKSLCYFVPIINAALKARKSGEAPRTRAIIVYPMNALANSQMQELDRWLGPRESAMVTHARYTSQDDQAQRERVRDNPPDILLTNFMMLEMLMTRQGALDRDVLANCEGLEFIVLDELHTYRGRQGADVAMLMRRLRSRVGDPKSPPLCIGTSATMTSENSPEKKNEAVAEIASKIFGTHIGPDAVVTETLRIVTRQEKAREDGTMPGLRDSVDRVLREDFDWRVSNEELRSDPLAAWVETRVGLQKVDVKAERGPPISLDEAAERLSKECGLPSKDCEEALKAALIQFSTPERDRGLENGSDKPLFTMRLHQFVSGAGRLYTTLRPEGERDVTLDGQKFNPANPEERLYSVHFCRSCGQEFHPVTIRTRDGHAHFEKREIDEFSFDDEDDDDEDVDEGFIMPEPLGSDFSFGGEDEDYPETWLEIGPKGQRRLKNHFKNRRARRYEVGVDGAESAGGRTVWYLPGRYGFCPNCRNTNTSSTRDVYKLSSLTAEGRSSATTVLLTTALRWMNDAANGIEEVSRKLLSFTDNRQDAALQAGHFNDFVSVTMLRGAIVAALRASPTGRIDEAELGARIQEKLGFLASGNEMHKERAAEWLVDPELAGQARNDAEALLRECLQHRFWLDQEREWRIATPNLEQLELVRTEYRYLDEIANAEEMYERFPLLREASVEERKKALTVLFDFMRRGLAVDGAALDRVKLEALAAKSDGSIKPAWSVPEDAPQSARLLHVVLPKNRQRLTRRDEDQILRGGPQSILGRKLREVDLAGRKPTFREVPDIVETLLEASEKFGGVVRSSGASGIVGWRLKASMVELELANAESGAEAPNRFFAGLYTLIAKLLEDGGTTLFGFEGREHTAQVDGELREIRELRFRYGEDEQAKLKERAGELRELDEPNRFLPTLFCSPTMELGVDISAMNVVYLRSAPPTPANYVQRSGRAGRSGQAALVLTYCAAQSPHDQYYFQRKDQLVDGVVVPPSIDLGNQDLVESHLHAEWLATLGAELDKKGLGLKDNISANLEVNDDSKPLNPDILAVAASPETSAKSKARILDVLEALERDYGDPWPEWYKGKNAETERAVSCAVSRFDAAFDRWRNLFSAAQRAKKLAEDDLNDHTTTARARRRQAEARLFVALSQITMLISTPTGQNSELYLYRYLATEGFIPGYNFPRLPMLAYVSGKGDGQKAKLIQRPRFIAIREFGPQSMIYHEGRVFRVDRALLKEAGGADDGRLPTESRALCPACGASHVGEHPERCHVCDGPLSLSEIVQNLYRVENVATRPVMRITSNDENRRRQGFDIQTTFKFDSESYTRSATLEDDGGPILSVAYAQAASITRMNRGQRRRGSERGTGFHIHPGTGVWGDRKNGSSKASNEPEVVRQQVVPMVEDRKNALLLRFPNTWLAALGDGGRTTLATLQHALARGIEGVFQLEEGEIQAEPTPSRKDRRAILFYEAAEGGAGALTRLAAGADGFKEVARKALTIAHFELSSFEDALADIEALKDSETNSCVAGCYRCVLSYYNQLDHEHIDRRDREFKRVLVRLAAGARLVDPGSGGNQAAAKPPLAGSGRHDYSIAPESADTEARTDARTDGRNDMQGASGTSGKSGESDPAERPGKSTHTEQPTSVSASSNAARDGMTGDSVPKDNFRAKFAETGISPDSEPLELTGVSIDLVWRSRRLAGIRQSEVTDAIEAELKAKGVRYVVIPDDNDGESEAIARLVELLRS